LKFNAAVLLCASVAAVLAMPSGAVESDKRLLAAADLDAFHGVSDATLSPDGKWVAYSVRSTDVARDKLTTDIWMTSWDGSRTVQLTSSADSEHAPGWSPDGRYVAVLSGRGTKEGPDQLWLLDRRGGDAQQVTHFKGDVLDYDWSPDGKRLALVVADDPLPGSDNDGDQKALPPIVIDRYYFKEDETGYLSARQKHLYLLDVASRTVDVLTPGRV
jgi:dipeptidyl aminopeptidase/acylaminoacyl peptidase